MVFNILWEMVVSSNIDMKINAANLLKVIVSYSVMELMLPAILDVNLYLLNFICLVGTIYQCKSYFYASFACLSYSWL